MINPMNILSSDLTGPFFHLKGTRDSLSMDAGLQQEMGPDAGAVFGRDGKEAVAERGLQEGPEPGALGARWVSGSVPSSSSMVIPPGWRHKGQSRRTEEFSTEHLKLSGLYR